MNEYNSMGGAKNKSATGRGITLKHGGHVTTEAESDMGKKVTHKSGVKTSKGETFHAGMEASGFKAGGHTNIHTGKCGM